MTEPRSPEIHAFWNESLAEELLHFLTKRFKCSDTAAEITHETFIRIRQNIRSNPPNNARALAYKIAINLANDYQRKINVRKRFNAEITPEFDVDAYPNAVPGPEQITMAQERLYMLQSALDELPEDCRTAFLLHSIDGLTHPEIAERLGVSSIKVYRLLIKATAHCELRLGETV